MSYNNAKDVFEKLPEVFNADAAQGVNSVFQFNISGEGGGNWHVAVKGGACSIEEGKNEAPNVTLTMETPTWISMSKGEINGAEAFMSGKLMAEGDIMLAQQFSGIFRLAS